jgi:hypothetical protein
MELWDRICYNVPSCLKYIRPSVYKKEYYQDINIEYKVSFKNGKIALYIYKLYGNDNIQIIYAFNGICKEGSLDTLLEEIKEIMGNHFIKIES